MGRRKIESSNKELEEEMEESLMSFVVKKRRTRKRKVKVCYVCGHTGFSNLLICCSECSNLLVHKYCLGIVPGSTEDLDDNFCWACEDCRVLTSEVTTSDTPGALTIDNMREIILVEDEPEPLCAVPPESDCRSSGLTGHSSQDHTGEQAAVAAPTSVYLLSKDKEELEAETSSFLVREGKRSLDDGEGPTEHVSAFMEHPREIMSGIILLVSPSGEVIIRSSMSVFDSSHVDSVSSFMDCPKEIMNGLVLLASTCGEVTIRSAFDNDAYVSNSSSADSNMASICCEVGLHEQVEKRLVPKVERITEYDCVSYLPETEGSSRKRQKILIPCNQEAQLTQITSC